MAYPPPSVGSSGVGFWTALLDAEVSHKSLVTLLYCLTERPKQVGLPELLQQVALFVGLQYLEGGQNLTRAENEAAIL